MMTACPFAQTFPDGIVRDPCDQPSSIRGESWDTGQLPMDTMGYGWMKERYRRTVRLPSPPLQTDICGLEQAGGTRSSGFC